MPATVNLFIGTPCLPGLAKQLEKMQKSDLIAVDGQPLVREYHQGKEYIGYLSASQVLRLDEIACISEKVKKSLERVNQSDTPDTFKIFIFPQVLIA